VQKVLSLISQAGGVGKTTIALNLAYIAYQKGKSVVIIDLDNNLSLNDFTGIPQVPYEQSIEKVFSDRFEGNWNLVDVFESQGKVSIVPGSDRFNASLISFQKRRENILRRNLRKYPLPYNLIILDNRGGSDAITDNSIVAATHILIPSRIGAKINIVPRLIEKLWANIAELELESEPKILGVLPNEREKGRAVHDQIMAVVAEELKNQEIKLYPAIPHNGWICNSNSYQIPIAAYRPGESFIKVFDQIMVLLQKSQEDKIALWLSNFLDSNSKEKINKFLFS
jgi:chromosome partitioning protein